MKTLTYFTFDRNYPQPKTDAEYWHFVAREMASPGMAYIGFPAEGKFKRIVKPKLCSACKGRV